MSSQEEQDARWFFLADVLGGKMLSTDAFDTQISDESKSKCSLLCLPEGGGGLTRAVTCALPCVLQSSSLLVKATCLCTYVRDL